MDGRLLEVREESAEPCRDMSGDGLRTWVRRKGTCDEAGVIAGEGLGFDVRGGARGVYALFRKQTTRRNGALDSHRCALRQDFWKSFVGILRAALDGADDSPAPGAVRMMIAARASVEVKCVADAIAQPVT